MRVHLRESRGSLRGFSPGSQWLRLALLALLLTLISTVGLAQTSDVSAHARELARNGERGSAIALLRDHLERTPDDDDARTLLGTVLSWESQYDDARGLLEQALARDPRNTDALSALMNVELWSGHPQRAQQVAEQGLQASLNDSRFLEGRRHALVAADARRPWQASWEHRVDWFGDDRGAWQESKASLRRATPGGPVFLRAARAERFALSGHDVEIEMYPQIRRGSSAHVGVGFATGDRLYPHYHYAVDVSQALRHGFEVSVGYRRLQFDEPANILSGSVTAYAGPWMLGGRVHHVPGRGAPATRAYSISARRYFGADDASYAGAHYGRGGQREDIRSVNDFEVLTSDTVAAELDTPIARRLRLTLQGSTGRQARTTLRSLRQHSFSLTLGVRF